MGLSGKPSICGFVLCDQVSGRSGVSFSDFSSLRIGGSGGTMLWVATPTPLVDGQWLEWRGLYISRESTDPREETRAPMDIGHGRCLKKLPARTTQNLMIDVLKASHAISKRSSIWTVRPGCTGYRPLREHKRRHRYGVPSPPTGWGPGDDCLAAKLRPGNVSSAEDWDELLLPEVAPTGRGQTGDVLGRRRLRQAGA